MINLYGIVTILMTSISFKKLLTLTYHMIMIFSMVYFVYAYQIYLI